MSNLCFTILAVLIMAAVLITVQLDVLSAVDK